MVLKWTRIYEMITENLNLTLFALKNWPSKFVRKEVSLDFEDKCYFLWLKILHKDKKKREKNFGFLRVIEWY